MSVFRTVCFLLSFVFIELLEAYTHFALRKEIQEYCFSKKRWNKVQAEIKQCPFKERIFLSDLIPHIENKYVNRAFDLALGNFFVIITMPLYLIMLLPCVFIIRLTWLWIILVYIMAIVCAGLLFDYARQVYIHKKEQKAKHGGLEQSVFGTSRYQTAIRLAALLVLVLALLWVRSR